MLSMPFNHLSLADLDNATGVVITGSAAEGGNGRALAAAGDVNDDGVADVLIGAPGENRAYVLFGADEGFDEGLTLGDIDGNNGFAIVGDLAEAGVGTSVAGVGDVNDDGVADVLIGVTNGFYQAESYLVFGRDDGFLPEVDLTALDGTAGVKLIGANDKTLKSSVVAGGGDVNGDGVADIVIGAPFASRDGFGFTGETYVVFGHGNGFAPEVDLTALDGTDGFALSGVGFGGQSGASVDNTGDVNGDGFADVLIGTNEGKAYLLFGAANGFPAQLALPSLNGSRGFVFDTDGEDAGGVLNVAAIGDINGDGIDDFALGAPEASPDGRAGAGQTYVVFGNADDFSNQLSLTALDGTDGFVLPGAAVFDESGGALDAAGDINGDGIGDLLIGAPGADGEGGRDVGASYIVYGWSEGFPAVLPLADLDAGDGIVLEGVDHRDGSGTAVAGLGDVNGDGIDDLAVGAPLAADRAGASYVVFGGQLAPSLGEVVHAINAGGPALTQDGIDFAADIFFTAGAGTFADNAGGNGEQSVFDDTVYETERYDATIEYALPVAPGSYTVELHFAELWWDTPGQRLFEVIVEGEVVAGDFDILETTDGDTDQATVLTIDGVVPDASGAGDILDIVLTADIENAKLSAIVVRESVDPGTDTGAEVVPEPGSGADLGLSEVDVLL